MTLATTESHFDKEHQEMYYYVYRQNDITAALRNDNFMSAWEIFLSDVNTNNSQVSLMISAIFFDTWCFLFALASRKQITKFAVHL